ncbi:uncharacterized protein TNCT_267871 [Trichonephila clavata]|uniref:Uncharacterized protein n=1 Tax=Trichonephila clavata TaxID=2740835 RepID=A0A8X6GRT2_TRICU|nr:uncharacterized protein TNCT_267871 [Trichonephila clavata]
MLAGMSSHLSLLESSNSKKMKVFVLLLLVGVASASFLEYERKKSARGVSDDWEKVKKNLLDNQTYLKKKYVDFEEWVKTVIANGKDNAAQEFEKVKSFYHEVIKDKTFGREAGEFLENYNGELKKVFENIRGKILEIARSKQ